MIIDIELREFVREYIRARERADYFVHHGCISCSFANDCDRKYDNPNRCFKRIPTICDNCKRSSVCNEVGEKWLCERHTSKYCECDVEFYQRR